MREGRARAAKRDLASVAKGSVKALCRADNFAGVVVEMREFLASHGHLGDVDDLVAAFRANCRVPDDLRRRGFRTVVEVDGSGLTVDGLCSRWKFTYSDRAIAQSYLAEDARRVRDDIGPAAAAWLASVRQRVAVGDDVQARSVDDLGRPWGRYVQALAEELENRSRLAEVVHPSREAYEAACRLAAERPRAEAGRRRRSARMPPVQPRPSFA